MAWKINYSYIEDDKEDIKTPVSVYGPGEGRRHGPFIFPTNAITKEQAEALDAGQGHRFRLFDDDGGLYYEGLCLEGPEGEEEEAFGPLDDYGTPNAGAVRIEYYDKEKKAWGVL